ncbi:MAG TPA: hypothetical protein VIP98_14595 [Microlunatus sp.]
MAMPNDLVLVRHGEAEGNVVREQALSRRRPRRRERRVINFG